MRRNLNHHKSLQFNKKKSAVNKNIALSRDYDREMTIREDCQIVKKQYMRGW